MWVLPNAFHTAALGYQPVDFRRRVFAFYDSVANAQIPSDAESRPASQRSTPTDPNSSAHQACVLLELLA
jgi:hypothetical protein